jgi:hypothetical protein
MTSVLQRSKCTRDNIQEVHRQPHARRGRRDRASAPCTATLDPRDDARRRMLRARERERRDRAGDLECEAGDSRAAALVWEWVHGARVERRLGG